MAAPPLESLRELDKYDGRIPLAVLDRWLAETVVTLDDVRPCLCF